MAYGSTFMANSILERSFNEGFYIVPMKLQRILYIASSEYLKMTGSYPLVERFSTWSYGPVLYSVYDPYIGDIKDPINCYYTNFRGEKLCVAEDNDPEIRYCIDKTWEVTRELSPKYLSEVLRVEGSAWDKAFQSGRAVLDIDDIREDTSYTILFS